MSTTQSFADFVKQSREKKKNESLAQQLLGSNRGRKATASGAGTPNQRSDSQKPSLLSRISGGAGVQKRSSSAKPVMTTRIDGKWQHDLHKLNNPNGPPTTNARLSRPASASQVDRNSRTYNKFASLLNENAGARNNNAVGFNIRGVASSGPYTVIASNFAPGTTANDIMAVMSPIGGEVLGCRLISAAPTVMAELHFVDKDGAENVVATFNNQKADGRVLYVYMKDTPPSTHLAQSRAPPARPSRAADDMNVDDGARSGGFQDGRFGSGEGRREPPRGPRRRY